MLDTALKAEGHGIITASDSHVALTLLKSLDLNQKKFPFDLMICDCMQFQVDEFEMCRWLRDQGSLVPILILSTSGNEADCIRALEAGADDFLAKPFNTQEFLIRCRALLRRHSLNFLPHSKVLQFKDILVYPQQHRVLVRGKEAYLSPKLFRLLEVFISNPHRVWSRQELFDQVWEPNFIPDTKTLDVHIRWLREKIELSPNRPKYVITVPRIGYRFG
ncbi:response regulator transcription factor [Tolypothrix campylonemoides VB511288]|nr:response regulator transcription factor [Tolypothrix campylonemoides VB511288]